MPRLRAHLPHPLTRPLHPALAAVALLGALALTAAPAGAEVARPSLPAQVGTAHFVVHYDPATATADYATTGAADFEESYSRLVTGGGGTPNAGLRAPVDDAPRGGDGRIDVYLTTPPGHPEFVGGEAVADGATYADPHVDSGFLYMTPTLSRTAFRFRAAHELMHVIQDAYIESGSLLTESTANWAAELALPDIDPRDSQFSVPFLPFTCAYGSWGQEPCGNGYRQWLFFQWVTEHYDVGFVHRLWLRHRTDLPTASPTTASIRTLLEQAIAAEPGDATLATVYADYMAALWDPTRWSTTAVDTLHREDGPPKVTEAGVSRATPTAQGTLSIDRIATRYLHIAHAGASAPGDQVHLTITLPPTGGAAPTALSATGPGRARTSTPLTLTSGTTYEGTVSLDGATIGDVVVPLHNVSATDGLLFTWKAELIAAGAPAGPANDERTAPLRIQPKTTTTLDLAYAGGLGATEAPDCPATRTATRGAWFIVLVDKGQLTVDARASDFDAAVAVYDVSISSPYLWQCAPLASRGFVTGETLAREYLIYVGRAAGSTSPGHTLRLAVDGTPNDFGQDGTDRTAPTITAAKLSPKRFRAAKSGGPITTKPKPGRGTKLTLTVSESAWIRMVFERRTTGRLVGGKCVKQTKRNRSRKRCDRYVASGSTALENLRSGAITINLTGRRTTRKALAAGTYRLRLTATDPSENRSAPVLLPFTIKR